MDKVLFFAGMTLRNATESFKKRLVTQMVYSYSILLINGTLNGRNLDKCDVKKKKSDQFKNLHRFSLSYLRPVRIILNVKNSAKILIILVCRKLEN